MRLFWEIVIALMVAFIFILCNVRWFIRYALIPVCVMMFECIPGKDAENFCNELCQTEFGEKTAKLFFLYYKFGYNCVKDEEGSKIARLVIEHPGVVVRMMNISKIPDIEIKQKETDE